MTTGKSHVMASQVFELRFEPRERRGLRLFAAAMWQAITLADTVPGNDAGGAGGAYVVIRRADEQEAFRIDVTHEEIGVMRDHLEEQLATLTADDFASKWAADE